MNGLEHVDIPFLRTDIRVELGVMMMTPYNDIGIIRIHSIDGEQRFHAQIILDNGNTSYSSTCRPTVPKILSGLPVSYLSYCKATAIASSIRIR